MPLGAPLAETLVSASANGVVPDRSTDFHGCCAAGGERAARRGNGLGVVSREQTTLPSHPAVIVREPNVIAPVFVSKADSGVA